MYLNTLLVINGGENLKQIILYANYSYACEPNVM